MSIKQQGKKRLVAVGIGLLFILLCIVGYNVFMTSEKKEVLKKTSSMSQYDYMVKVLADAFSGYAVIRSDRMAKDLKRQRVKLNVISDNANYEERLQALIDGKADMAVFTVDALIKASVKLGKWPASIVMVFDETKGADAMVAFKPAVSSIQDLDNPNACIVATPNSPSEFVARIVLAQFSLISMPDKWLVEAKGAEGVLKKMEAADRSAKCAYVMWEPYVSKALKLPGAHILLDTSKVKGLVVDVWVARREYINEHPERVKVVMESYFRAAHSYREETNGMVNLVKKDSNGTLTEAEAKKIVAGIHWKTTMDNYAHFGLVPEDQRGGISHLEDSIERVIDVMIKTGSLKKHPLKGKVNTLFYTGAIQAFHDSGFHPAKKKSIIAGVGATAKDLTPAEAKVKLAELDDQQWQKLQQVGNARVEPISFIRGSSDITISSEADLDDLAKRLEALPEYRVKVIGFSRAGSDAAADKLLASQRAESAKAYLISKKVEPVRLKAYAAPPSQKGGAAQSVQFVLVQQAY